MKPFPPTLRAILVNLVKAETKREKAHWKKVALKYIDFLLERS